MNRDIFMIIAGASDFETAKSLSLLSRKCWELCDDQYWESKIYAFIRQCGSGPSPTIRYIIDSRPVHLATLILYWKLMKHEFYTRSGFNIGQVINDKKLYGLLYQTLKRPSVEYLNSVIIQCVIHGQINAAKYLLDKLFQHDTDHDYPLYFAYLKQVDVKSAIIDDCHTTAKRDFYSSSNAIYHMADRILTALVETKQYDHYKWAMRLQAEKGDQPYSTTSNVIWCVLNHIADDQHPAARALMLFLYEKVCSNDWYDYDYYQFIKKIERQSDFQILRPVVEPIGRYRHVRQWRGDKHTTICFIICGAILIIVFVSVGIGLSFIV